MTVNRRTRDYAREAADQFDASVLHNRVYDQVQGQHGGDTLRRFIALSEDCYRLADDRERDHDRDDDVRRGAWDAAESLNAQIDTLVEEAIARACAVVVNDAPEWTDHWDEAELDAAAHEAREWLQAHTEAAARAGVLDDLEIRA